MGNEILMIVDAVSREKGVEKEIIFQALEAALATATRKRHAGDIDARVAIHRDTGKSRLSQSNSGALPRRRPSRSSCRRCARPSASRS